MKIQKFTGLTQIPLSVAAVYIERIRLPCCASAPPGGALPLLTIIAAGIASLRRVLVCDKGENHTSITIGDDTINPETEAPLLDTPSPIIYLSTETEVDASRTASTYILHSQ